MAMMSKMHWGIGAAVLAVGAASLGGAAAPVLADTGVAARQDMCTALRGKVYDGAQVDAADYLAAGAPIPAMPLLKSPGLCRVRAHVASAPGSEIKIEISLPDTWNGKLFGVGGGGFEGGYDMAGLTLLEPARKGFAGVATNSGHDRAAIPKWAFNQPVRIEDFGNRGNHLGAAAAKRIAASFYGSQVKRSVFHGCSNGGRDALILAQRYPQDYDAIVVGAPANDYSGLMSSFAHVGAVSRSKGVVDTLGPKLALLRDAAIAKCDGMDGIKDGVIGNPLTCRFNPAVLACKPGASGTSCLTPAELGVVRSVYGDVRLHSGKVVMPGLPVGSEPDWTGWLTGPKAEGPNMAVSFYRNFVHADDNWSLTNFNLDREWAAGRATVSPAIDALNPDIKPFLQRGGKLLMYHGWGDAAIPAGNSIRYFTAMRRTVGSKLAASTRLFMLSGVGHCAGGPGPDVVDYLSEADRWAQTGAAPARLVAAKYANPLAAFGADGGKALRSRPVCAWPKTSFYSGKGSKDEAASYVCR